MSAMFKVNDTHVILARLEVEGCTAELLLNGIPLVRLGKETTKGTSLAAQQFLIGGSNTLELLVEPGSRPSRSRTDFKNATLEGARAKGWLTRFRDGSMPNPDFGEKLIEVEWRFGEGGQTVESFPREVAKSADLGAIVPRWSYQDGAILSIENALVEEAHEVLEKIAEAFRQGSGAGLWGLLEEQSREAVLAYPALTEAMVRSDLERKIARYHESKEPVLPLSRDRYDFRLVAGGRMLHCVDEDGTASLKLRHPIRDQVLPYRIFLARVGGALRVVR